jgi:hypothetical protein
VSIFLRQADRSINLAAFCEVKIAGTRSTVPQRNFALMKRCRKRMMCSSARPRKVATRHDETPLHHAEICLKANRRC